ncbi:shikimate kinase [Hanstruepera ponticola]|uniref:shikimate kinase n=1 Tax=Hanstruepera ponticola TaxID=2042995 RepID=UPI001785ED8E|nr:shikimate kinase [Hanstruepera ponticola]
MNIFLLGYMGSGKSYVGQKLSKVLDMPFVDLDDYIEKKEGRTIEQIFNSKGEIYFRKLENACLKELIKSNLNAVIALGGGTPCYANNMELISNSQSSKSIYLQVSIQELSKRLFDEKHNRPLLKFINSNDELLEFIGKHLFERKDFYNKADLTIDANGEPSEIIEKIILKLF